MADARYTTTIDGNALESMMDSINIGGGAWEAEVRSVLGLPDDVEVTITQLSNDEGESCHQICIGAPPIQYCYTRCRPK